MPNTIRHTGLPPPGGAAAPAGGLLVPAAEGSGGSVSTSAPPHQVAMLSDVVTKVVAVDALVLS